MSKNPFPATLEVERELYYSFDYSMIPSRAMFPAPLEVDWQLFDEILAKNAVNAVFPAPREVDRYLYWEWKNEREDSIVSVPSRGRQVSIQRQILI